MLPISVTIANTMVIAAQSQVVAVLEIARVPTAMTGISLTGVVAIEIAQDLARRDVIVRAATIAADNPKLSAPRRPSAQV